MVYKAKHYSRLRKLLCLASTFMVESVLRFLMGAILALKLCTSRRFDKILLGKKHNNSQGVSCDRFLGRTHSPRTSRLRCARTRVRTPNLKWSHFAPAPALLVKQKNSSITLTFFHQFFNIFMVF